MVRDQEDIVANPPSKRSTRAVRIVRDDDKSARYEEGYELEQEGAGGVRLPSLVADMDHNKCQTAW